MKKFACALAILGVAVSVLASPTVSNVVVQQRYPWNGLVDITFDLENGSETTSFPIEIFAKVKTTGEDLPVTTIYRYGMTVADGLNSEPGHCHFIWDAGADVPNRNIGDVEFTVMYPLYIVIDLSSGSTSTNYPVMFLPEPPSGGFNVDEYKTTKLVMRRTEPGKYEMGDIGDSRSVAVTLTKASYIGLFEVTQKPVDASHGLEPGS